MEINEQKNIERLRFKLLRAKISQEDRENIKKNVEEYLTKFFLNKKHRGHIGIYWPINNEVDLRFLKEKYPVALPKCESLKKLKFYTWDESPLKDDSEGIPSPNNLFLLGHDQLSIMLIPCLSIDKRFIRLGYGGGYFDRLRADKNWGKVPSIGILTSSCVSEGFLASSEFDIPLSGYITEKEIVI